MSWNQSNALCVCVQPAGPAGLRQDGAAKIRLFGAVKTLPASPSAGKVSSAGAVGASRLRNLALGQDLGCRSCAQPCRGVLLGGERCCCGPAPPRPHLPVGAQRLLQTAPSPACKANTYVAQSGSTAASGRRRGHNPGRAGVTNKPFWSLSGSSGAAGSSLWGRGGPSCTPGSPGGARRAAWQCSASLPSGRARRIRSRAASVPVTSHARGCPARRGHLVFICAVFLPVLQSVHQEGRGWDKDC